LRIAIELTAQDSRQVLFSSATAAGASLIQALPHAF
jgi:hypothetical protein